MSDANSAIIAHALSVCIGPEVVTVAEGSTSPIDENTCVGSMSKDCDGLPKLKLVLCAQVTATNADRAVEGFILWQKKQDSKAVRNEGMYMASTKRRGTAR